MLEPRAAGALRGAALLLLCAAAVPGCRGADIATGCSTDHALHLTSARSSPDAPDLGEALLSSHVTLAAWVRLGAAPADLSRIIECSAGDGVDQLGIGFRKNVSSYGIMRNVTMMVVDNVTSDGVQFEFYVVQTGDSGAAEVGSAAVGIPPEWYTDENWHHFAAVYNGTARPDHDYTTTVTFYLDLVEAGTRTGVPVPRNATRSSCYVGRGADPAGPGLVGYVRDALVYADALDLPTLAYAASGPQAAVAVEMLEQAGACSAECMELEAVGVARNVAFAPTAAAPFVADGYVTVHRLPASDAFAALLLYGGGTGCSGGILIYAWRDGVGLGYGVGVAGNPADDVRTAPGLEVAVEEPQHIRVEVDAVAARIFVAGVLRAEEPRGWRAVPGSISVLSACHDVKRAATDGVLQLLKVGCLPALPPGALESHPPVVERRVWPRIAEEGAVAGVLVPLYGTGLVRWQRADVDPARDPRGSWHTELVDYSVGNSSSSPANVTAIAVIAHTQVMLACDSAAVWRSPDGGLNWTEAIAVDCAHLVVLDTGLALFAEAGDVWRSEDLGITWTRTGVPGGLVLDGSRLHRLTVVPNGLVLAYAEARPQIWESRDGGVNWKLSGAVRALAGAAGCVSVGAFTNVTHGLVACGTVMALTRDGGLRWLPVIHRVRPPEVDMLHGALGGMGFLLRSGTALYHSVNHGRTWAIAATASDTFRDVVQIREGMWAAIAPGEIHVTEDGGASYLKAVSYVYSLSATFSAAFAPLCHPKAACAGRGTCLYGLVWPGWGSSCECEAPWQSPDCRELLSCEQVRSVLGKPDGCATRTHIPAPEQAAPATACTWRKVEVRPGITRWRCAPPHEDPYDPAFAGTVRWP